MLTVRRVVSNLKGGFSADLGERTLIVAPNGAGKSRIVQAIELALTGQVDDVGGKTFARESELMSLAPGRAGELHVTATLSDGSAATCRVRGSTEKASRAERSPPPGIAGADSDAIFPLRAVEAAAAGSAETLRRFLLTAVVPASTWDAVKSRVQVEAGAGGLAANLDRAVSAAADAGGSNTAPVDLLVALRAGAAKLSRAARATAAASASSATDAARGLAAPPSDADIEGTRRVVETARERLEIAVRASERAVVAGAVASPDDIARLRADLAAARAKRDELAAMKASIETAPPPGASPILDKVLDIVRWAKSHAKASRTCVVCKHDTTPEALAAREVEIETNTTTTRTRAAEWRAALGLAAQYLDAVEVEVRRLEATLAANEATARAVTAAPSGDETDDTVLTPDAARTALRAAEDHHTRLATAKSGWAAAERAHTAAKDAEREADAYAAVAAATDRVVGALLASSIAGFVERVQSFLPATDRFDMHLLDGEKPVCRFGLVRDDALRTALSGAEWARVTAAMAAAVGGLGANRSALRVIIPRDRAFDPITLAGVMAALGQAVETGAVTQIVMTSPVAPAAPVPGWTVIVPADDPTVPGGQAEASAASDNGAKPKRRRIAPVVSTAVGAAPAMVAPPTADMTEVDLFG